MKWAVLGTCLAITMLGLSKSVKVTAATPWAFMEDRLSTKETLPRLIHILLLVVLLALPPVASEMDR